MKLNPSFIKSGPLSERVEITPVDKPGHHQKQKFFKNESVKVQTIQFVNIKCYLQGVAEHS